MMKIINQASLLSLLLASVLGCSSPGVTNQQSEKIVNGIHWFSNIDQSDQQALTYISSKQPYLSNFKLPRPSAELQRQYLSQVPFDVSPTPPLSPGDRITVWLANGNLFASIFNDAESAFSSVFEINIDGKLTLPYIKPLTASGLTLPELTKKIEQALVSEKMFKQGKVSVQLAIAEWAPVTVFVSGSVFNPGQVTINQRRPEERQMMRSNQSGDSPIGRLIQNALAGSGGVTPDADVANIELVRNGKVYNINLLGAVLGTPTPTVVLTHGDVIRVNSTATSQIELIKPSSITPPGLRISVSNLTRPAFGNATSAIGKDSTNLPYGTRLLTASINGNCAGGAVSTNSNRIVVLVSTDPLTKKRIAIERHIEDLLRAPNRLDLNPFIMPNDSIVCYDSKVSNVRDIGLAITEVLFPASLLLKGINVWQ